RDGDSTTNAGGETPSSAAMPPPPGAVPRGSSFEREPDGDADEDRASTSSDFGGIDPASRDQGDSPDEPDRDERGDEPRKPWP
ncbi:MAG: hypothetical protein ACO3ZY_04505, partial [Phycisphaerales bacterium]